MITVEVTQNDIDLGRGGFTYGNFCPIERAITRAVGEPVMVGYRSFYLASDINRRNEIKIPDETVEFIKAWEAKEVVEPFTFQLEL